MGNIMLQPVNQGLLCKGKLNQVVFGLMKSQRLPRDVMGLMYHAKQSSWRYMYSLCRSQTK